MMRQNDQLMPTSWDKAISHVALELNRIIKDYGPDAVAFFSGAACFSEEYYLANKLMKAVIGSNNVESTSRLCMSSTAMGFISTLGADAPPTCYADMEEADLFFIAGNNMAVSLPVIFQRICAVREKNSHAKVIVIDPRITETASIADIHLQIRPATDVALNNSLAYVLINNGFVDEEFVKKYTTGFEDLKELVQEYPPSRAARITGCSEKQIFETAITIGQSKAMLTFWLQGYNQSTQAVFKNNTLHNLLLLTGNYCRVGAGPLSITGEANTMACRWIGALSHLLPGMRLVSNSRHREEVAELWGTTAEKINPIPGRSIIDIIKGLHSGDIRALWVLASNPAASLPHTEWVKEALSKAELLIVQDIFHPTETSMFANVVLAGAQWCEKTGTFISSERRIQLAEKVIAPPGNAKSDCDIICMIAKEMGFADKFLFTSPEEVFEELKKTTSGRICDANGVSYDRLRNSTGPQLPCPTDDHPGTKRLFENMQFPRPDGRAALLARHFQPPSEQTDGEYPFALITGRMAPQFNTGTRTGRITHLDTTVSTNFVEIHPNDAKDFETADGDVVDMISRRGRVRGIVSIQERVLPGTVYMNLHFGEVMSGEKNTLANLVCNPVYDNYSKQPEYKFCAVKIVKI
ncbi:MAG: nitrate reductase catalytic subunit [Candidatus Scalindua sp.]|nr:MAG: nitrate reductase catalytic subunit [Candidatus Scalindua sp.]